MRRAVIVALAAFSFALPAVAQPGPEGTSTSLPLRRVAVELPALDVATIVLQCDPAPSRVLGPFTAQRLRLGQVEVPLLAPAKMVAVAGATAVQLEVQLRAVPEQVLGLPLERVPVSWEGVSENGLERLTISGEVNPTDPNSVAVPLGTLYERYSKIADVKVYTDEGRLYVRVLASLYNPFAFDLTASMIEYKVRAGDKQIIAGQKRGFRARGRRWSDVVLEQPVDPAEAASGGFAALLRPSSVQAELTLSIRTPTGDRPLTLTLGG